MEILLALGFTVLGFGIIFAHGYWKMTRGQKQTKAIATMLGFEPTLKEGMSLDCMEGDFKEYHVIIAPDHRRSISVPLKHELPVYISTDTPHGDVREGMATFDFESRALNLLFPTRQAAPELTKWLGAHEVSEGPLASLESGWGWAVREQRGWLQIEHECIICRPSRGWARKRMALSFLFKDDVAGLLPLLVDIARALDAESETRERPSLKPKTFDDLLF